MNRGFADTRGGIGFRAGTSLDESPETVNKTRLAVAAAKAGDEHALRYLYCAYADNIYGYVRSIVRDEHEAEDVTQTVFTKLIVAIHRYDDRGVPFVAWLLRMARNQAIDHLRTRRPTPTENTPEPRQPVTEDLDHAQRFRDALATLPREQRHVVYLRHVIGLSPTEIAARLGRTENSIHALHHRGRRALQEELTRVDAVPSTRRRVPACV
jgi:RNA polymerase sigma-70 factor (ECF subfamily)